MARAREGIGHGNRIADLGIDAEIGGNPVPHQRRVAAGRLPAADRGRKRFIVDPDFLHAVLRRRWHFGNDHDDGLADEARLVRRERPMRMA